MRKIRNVLALVLAGCLMLTVPSTEVFAQEEQMASEVLQGQEEIQEEQMASEVLQGQEEIEEAEEAEEIVADEQKEACEEQSVQEKTSDAEEMIEELDEAIVVDPEDPGKYRLTGQGEGEVKFSQISTQAVSSASKYADCIVQKGIDVSYHNGRINWEKVKKAGVDFAIIRVCYRGYNNGKLAMDEKALENMKNANAAGVPIGVYIFSQAISTKEAVQEANYIVSKIKGYKIDLPVVLDFEYVANGVGRLYKAKLSKSAATSVCMAFCNQVKKLGYTPMVYANKSMYQDKTYAADISQPYPIWMAHYTKGTTDYAGEYEYWQYSSSGEIDGINSKYVDMNFRYVNSLRITGKTSNSISMKWDTYGDELSYDVYRKNGSGNYTLLKGDVSGTTFTDTALNPGQSYSYKIYTGGKCIGFNTGITTLDSTKVSGKGTAFDKVKLSWLKVAGASIYYVQRYDSSKKAYTTVQTLKGNSKVSCVDGSKNASTTYKYRIRPCKVVFNGRAYGSYSNEVAVKTKGAVKGKTKSRGIYLRKSASKSSKKLGTLRKKGTKVTVIGSCGSWYRLSVKINGKKRIGYMKKSNIKLY